MFALTLIFITRLCASWWPVTTNADGSPITDLAYYTLKIGVGTNGYPLKMKTGLTPSYCLSIMPGHYCAVVTASDTSGNESAASSEVCIDLGISPSPSPTPAPLTLEQRVRRLEERVFGP